MRPQQIIAARRRKSPAIAIFLTLVFGGLGLLYVSIIGGIILFAATVIMVYGGYKDGALFCWIISILWAILATTNLKRIFD